MFNAFIVNLSKLYSMLGLTQIILYSPKIDENSKINHILKFFPDILKVLEKIKTEERERKIEKQETEGKKDEEPEKKEPLLEQSTK